MALGSFHDTGDLERCLDNPVYRWAGEHQSMKVLLYFALYVRSFVYSTFFSIGISLVKRTADISVKKDRTSFAIEYILFFQIFSQKLLQNLP